MKKTFYLAGRLGTGEGQIGDFAAELEKHHHTVLEKWWERDPLPKPYLDNREQYSMAAYLMIRAAAKSDICILFPQGEILGAAIEFGAAVGSTLERADKRVIVANLWDERQSIFYTHPRVEIAQDMDMLRKMVL